MDKENKTVSELMYNFEKRVGDAKKLWDRKIEKLMRKGADRKNINYKIMSVNPSHMTIQVIFPAEIHKLMSQCLKHSDIQKIIKVLKPTLFKITGSGVVAKGEEGLSAITHLLVRCYKKLEGVYDDEMKKRRVKKGEKRNKILETKKKIRQDAERVLENIPYELIDIRLKGETHELIVVFYKKRKRAYKKNNRLIYVVDNRVRFVGSPESLIIQLEKYLRDHKLTEDAK